MKNYKKLKHTVKTVSVTSLLIIVFSYNGFSQENKKHILFNMWDFNTYKFEGKKYMPKKKEKGDYILINKDMTFVSKSEGKLEKGTFILNTNGGYIEFTDENGETLKAYIISITEEALILKFDVKEIRDIEVHYNRYI